MIQRKYETLVLLSPELAADSRKEVLENLAAIIDREDGKVLELDEWGMRELAYPVKKQTRGYYVRFEYAAPGQAVAELERNIRLSDDIWKFMSVKLEDEYKAEEA